MACGLKGIKQVEKAELDFKTEISKWQAVVNRDSAAEGIFVYGVSTTAVYCRPVCKSRLPKRENVKFFETWQQAEQAGFRPCKRCQPRSQTGDAALQGVIQACRLIESADRPLSLSDLAGMVGMSKYHFHRLFKKALGVTPHQYAASLRLDKLRSNLEQNESITTAIYAAGFESAGNLYNREFSALGMNPSTYRSGGKGMTIRFAISQSYLGWVLIASTQLGLCKIEFGDSAQVLEHRLRERFPFADFLAEDSDFQSLVSRTLAYMEQPANGHALPLDIQGTVFQRRVWEALRKIPCGSTASYGEIAAQIGNPHGSRAVAQACAANPLAVVIPCHRVIRQDGEIGGYRWGMARKKMILEKEIKR